VISRPSSDDPPPRGPRHIWTGDWLAESERARLAAEEAAARLEEEIAARQALEEEEARAAEARRVHGPSGERTRGPADRGPGRRRVVPLPAVIVLAVVLMGLAFAGAYAIVDDDPADPLPAVSGEPLKPRKGQTRAGAVYAAASPAVVSVRAGRGSGTGFLTSAEGQLVTNAHVVGSSRSVTIRFGDGKSLRADVLGTDPSTDLAVLSVDGRDLPKGVKPLRFADSREVRVGDLAIAIGNPFGLDRTATEGIVSGLGRSLPTGSGSTISSPATFASMIWRRPS
jgi:putative serine protease PepD